MTRLSKNKIFSIIFDNYFGKISREYYNSGIRNFVAFWRV